MNDPHEPKASLFARSLIERLVAVARVITIEMINMSDER